MSSSVGLLFTLGGIALFAVAVLSVVAWERSRGSARSSLQRFERTRSSLNKIHRAQTSLRHAARARARAMHPAGRIHARRHKKGA